MNYRNNEYGELIEIIKEELKYFGSFPGRVVSVDDQTKSGMVQCTCDDLGWTTPDLAAWCCPEFPINSSNVPPVGSYVKVYFMGGDRNRPYYGPKIGGFQGNVPVNIPKTVLFEDALENMPIYFDDVAKILYIGNGAAKIVIDCSEIDVNKNSDYLTLFTELNTQMQTLVLAIQAELVKISAAITALSGSYTPGTLSLDLSSAKTITIKTGG